VDAFPELLLSGLARTTVCTTLAALTTLLLLPALGVRSTRIHRTAWVLVILQGWILIPLTFTVSVPSVIQLQQLPDTSITRSEPLLTVYSPTIPQAVKQSSWQRVGKQTATAAWLLGTLAVLGFYIKRYYSLFAHVPIGSVPESREWRNEWREATGTISPQTKVHFRVTSRVGPLLCFVPFVYLVLVPRLLWASLSRDDRIAILRHELAHLNHGDLWKNVAIRILALPQWFNPLAWLAVRRFEEAGEWACDEEVLATSNLANTGYANTLLRVAGFSADAPCGAVAASGGVLTRRVTRLLSSSDKEVSKMKNLAIPLLLLAVAAGQAIRIESVLGEEPAKPAAVETRAEAVAKWREEPYRIEPPDVLSIELTWNDFDVEFEGSRLQATKLHVNDNLPVGPDGTIGLGGFLGQIYVAGMTVEEVKKAVVEKLSERYGIPQVKVEVAIYNSKVVYVIEKTNAGDFAARIPHPGPGPLRVLDALASRSNQFQAFDDIVRVYVMPTSSPADRLEVDLDALSSGNNDSANFELLPGDRVFVLTNAEADEAKEPTPATPPTAVQQGAYYAPAHPASPVLPNPVKYPEKHSAPPVDTENALAPLAVGSLVVITLRGDIARHWIQPLKELNGPTPGLEVQIAASVVEINSNGNLVVKATGDLKLDDRKLLRSISGVVRPDDVGKNNHVNSDDIASLEIDIRTTKAR